MQPADNSLEDDYSSPEVTVTNPTWDGIGDPPRNTRPALLRYNHTAFAVTIIALLVMLLIGFGGLLLSLKQSKQATASQNGIDYAAARLSVKALQPSQELLAVGSANRLDINGQLRVNQGLVLKPTGVPANPTAGQIYYDQTTNAPYYYDGRQFISLAPSVLTQYISSIGGASGALSLGNGLRVANNQLSLVPDSSAVQGSTTLTCASGIGNLAGGGNSLTLASGGRCGDITITDNPTFSGTLTVASAGGLALGAPNAANGSINFSNGANANVVGLQSGASASSFTLTLPTTAGNNGDCLQSLGSGVLAFAACTGGTGGGVTSLDAQTGVLTLANSSGLAGVITIDDASTSQKGIAQFNATNFTAVAGVINTAQDIATTSSPTFANLNVTGQYQVGGLQVSSANLSDDANLAKLNGSGPQVFNGDNKFTATVLLQNAVDSTGAFKIQNAGGSSVLNVDTTTGRIGVNNASPSYALDVNGDINSNTAVRVGGITVCTVSNCVPASGSNNYIQNGTTTQDLANFSIRSAATNAVTAVLQGANGQTADILDLLSWDGSSTTTLAKFDNTGALTVKSRISVGTAGTPTGQLYVSGQVPTAAVGSITTASAPQAIAIQGRYAYVVNIAGTDALTIYDVSNPASPVALGSVATGADPYALSVQGRYAYVVNIISQTMTVYDISNPSAPTLVGSVATGAAPLYIQVQGRYAYVLNNGSNTMTIYDISNPAAPTLTSTVTTGPGSAPEGLYIQGRYVYVVNENTASLAIYDVANPASPTLVGTVVTGGSPINVSAQGRYAYVTNFTSSTMTIYDVSNPASPTLVSTVATGAAPFSISVQGRYAYVTESGGSTMTTYDVSNPSAPAAIGTVATGGFTPRSISVQGRYAYILNLSSNLMTVFDVGGAYVQQLETGGIEAGTLRVNGDTSLGGAVSVQGGLGVDGSAQIAGNFATNGSVKLQNSVNSTAAFQIQNATGTQLLNADTTNLVVTVGTGTGTLFAPKVDYTTNAGPFGVASADFNGDGKRDMAVANQGNSDGTTMSVFMGNGDGTFAAKVDYTTGIGPGNITAADFNGDGKPDLAVTNFAGGVGTTMSVFINNGDGTFAAKVDYTTNAGPFGVTSSDFNSDTKPDLVVTNWGASGVGTTMSVFLGNGDGTFAAKVDYTTGAGPRGVVVADFNGDNKSDVAVTNYGASNGSTLSILIGNGDGTFAAKVDYAAGSTPEGITSADFNGDGKADLAVADWGGNGGTGTTAGVLLGNGDGTFAARVDYPSGTGARGIVNADFNGDGKPDLALTNFGTNNGTTLSVLINSGTGSFAHAADYTTGSVPRGITSADFNGDGRPDLVAANSGNGGIGTTVSVFINQTPVPGVSKLAVKADEGAAGITLQVAQGSSAPALQVTDASGNVLTKAKSDGGVQIGDPTMFATKVDYPTTAAPREVTTADFNGDGKPDIATTICGASCAGTTMSVFMNNGNGTFAAKVDYTTGSGAHGITSADFNSDGKPDLAVTDYSSGAGTAMSVFINNGNGTFAAKVDYTTGTAPREVVAADFNGDNKIDLAVTNYGSATGTGTTLSVFIGTGTGTFAAKVDYTTGTGPYGITAADFNGDGKPDLAVTNRGNNNGTTASVLMNNGNGTFAARVNYTTGTAPSGITSADLNGDTKLDLAIANFSSNTISVLKNNGNGTFAAKVDYTTGVTPINIVANDLNADGKPDLAVTNFANGIGTSTSVFINNANGTFAPKVDYTTGLGPTGLASADFNVDGKPDLVVTNYGTNANAISVLLNQTSAASRLSVSTSDPTQSLLTLQGAAGQTADLLRIEGGNGSAVFNLAASGNAQLNQGQFSIADLGVATSQSLAIGSNQGGSLSGAAATTYYYKITSLNAVGESLATSELSVNGASFTPLVAPVAPTAVTNLAAGNVVCSAGSPCSWKYTYVTPNGETTGGTATANQTVNSRQWRMTITVGPAGTTARKLYRSTDGVTYKLAVTINDNTTTTGVIDNTAPGGLGANAPVSNTATTNTNNVTLSWQAVVGASSYRIYRGTSPGGENAYQTSTSSPFTDTGAAGTAGTVSASSSVARLGVGISTPTANLDVRGTVLFKNGVDSTAAFQVQNVAGATLLGVDTATSSIFSGVADGATAVGFKLNVTNSYVTAGAKLLSVQNGGVEKFFIDKDGTVGIVPGASVAFQGSGNTQNVITKKFVCTVATAAGDVVAIDTANAGQVTTVATGSSPLAIGVVSVGAGAGGSCDVALSGVMLVNIDTTATNIGDMIVTSATAGKGAANGAPGQGQVVAKALSAKAAGSAGTVWAVILGGR